MSDDEIGDRLISRVRWLLPCILLEHRASRAKDIKRVITHGPRPSSFQAWGVRGRAEATVLVPGQGRIIASVRAVCCVTVTVAQRHHCGGEVR